MILLEVNCVCRRDFQIIHELVEDLWICTGPGKDRLLVIANGENVVVLACKLVNNAVLSRIQILKLINKECGPLCAHCGCSRGVLHQLCRLEQEHVEIHDVPVGEDTLIIFEDCSRLGIERVTIESVIREETQEFSLFPGM